MTVNYDPAIHHRRSIRLQGYDYASAGAYFITICTQQRACLFGDVIEGSMHLNEIGQIVQANWQQMPQHYPNITAEAFVVMPNHLHGILCITEGAITSKGAINRAPTVGEMVRGFKARCTHAVGKLPGHCRQPLWQRNYHEHILRNEQSYLNVLEYIKNNPQQWSLDSLNPENTNNRQEAVR